MIGPLIDARELALSMAATRAPVVLDVRWNLQGPPGREGFDAGHIPGARFVDLDGELAGPPGNGRGRHPLPDPEAFGKAMRRAGVSGRSRVVVYDGGSGLSAARAWWLLRDAGLADVRLLDGGLAAWRHAGFPLSQVDEPVPAGDFVPQPGAMPVVDAARAAELARTGLLLDARSAERYRGEVEPVDPVAGHIPGARSAPTTANVGEDGRLLAPLLLQERFATLGALPGADVAVYCGSGVTAAHEVLALEVAGIEAALYPGSWSEWVSDPERPVATGADPG